MNIADYYVIVQCGKCGHELLTGMIFGKNIHYENIADCDNCKEKGNK